MIIPSTPADLERVRKRDLYGQEKLEKAEQIYVSVVRLTQRDVKTSVRADSSGSRGAAHEQYADSTVLVLPYVDVAIGDKLTVGGIMLKIVEIQARFDVRGQLDHNQVRLEAWV